MRLTVHVCERGNPGIGRALRTFTGYPEAKRYAERRANDFQWGTVIVDQIRQLADWGNGWTLADDCEVDVEAPSYARGDNP